MSAADPRDPAAARPEFAAFVAALRGGEEFCRCFPSRVGGEAPDPDCPDCHGSGRVAVPPDPAAAHMAADWWQEQGGTLAEMLTAYAGLTEPCPNCGAGAFLPRRRGPDGAIDCCDGSGTLPDDSLRPALVALTERDDDPRVRALTAAVRGLRLLRGGYRINVGPAWQVAGFDHPGRESGVFCMELPVYGDESAARRALKRAVLSLYDPHQRVPCRAEGARLTRLIVGAGEWPLAISVDDLGRLHTPNDRGLNAYRLDGVRVGAPPDWSWTPHALPCPAGCRRGRVDPPCDTCDGVGRVADPDSEYIDGTMDCPDCDSEECAACRGSGGRLLVTWECRPSSLLPAATAASGWQAHARAVREFGVVPLDLTHGPLTD